MNRMSYELVVIGGGVAGCAAALAAARRGIKTALIDKGVTLGGLATNGLVLVYLPLCDGCGHQVSFGITEELLQISNQYGPIDEPAWKEGKKRYMTYYSPASLILALDELMINAGVDLWYDTVLTGCQKDESNRVRTIEVWNKSGKIELEAGCFIDATGDADLAWLAGNPCHTATNALVTWVIEHKEKDSDKVPFPLGKDTHIAIVAEQVDTVSTKPGISGKIVSDFVIASRMRYLNILKETYNSGAENRKSRYPISLPSMPTLRHSRCISARTPLLENNAWKPADQSIGVAADWRKSDSIWELPYGMLVPVEVEGVLAAGRAAGAIGDAWEISRVIPAAALTGEVAGVASVIALNQNILPSQVDYQELSAELQRGRTFPLTIKDLNLNYR